MFMSKMEKYFIPVRNQTAVHENKIDFATSSNAPDDILEVILDCPEKAFIQEKKHAVLAMSKCISSGNN